MFIGVVKFLLNVYLTGSNKYIISLNVGTTYAFFIINNRRERSAGILKRPLSFNADGTSVSFQK